MHVLFVRLQRVEPTLWEPRVFTRLSVYPKEVGEHLNRLDRMGLRLGIVIECRYAAADAAMFERWSQTQTNEALG